MDKLEIKDLSKNAFNNISSIVEADSREIGLLAADLGDGQDWKWGNGIISSWRTTRDPTYYPGYAFWSVLM